MTTHTGGDPLSRSLVGKEFAPLTAEDTARISSDLLSARQAGDATTCRRLRDELVKRHLRLVVSLSRGYLHKLDAEEAFAVGSLALLEAMERWDPTPGGMSPYQWARRWVVTALNKATDANRVIRIPEQVAYKAALNTKAVKELENATGRRLSAEEIERLTGGGPRLEDFPIANASIHDNAYSGGGYASAEQGLTIEEVTPDPNETAEEIVERDDLYRRIREALSTLTDEERTVVRHRFGLEGAEGMTLVELGKLLGTSGEAVRRLEASALAKLTHPANPYNIGGSL